MCAMNVVAFAGDTWFCPQCGRKNDGNFCPNDGTAKPNNGSSGLSRNKKCPVQPQIYSNKRFKDADKEFGMDLPNDISRAHVIRQLEIGNREYGLYLKFTPSWMDQGYYIYRIDFVMSDPKGTEIYSCGMDTSITCEADRFVEWNFFSLMDMFREQLDVYGSISTGKYTMDIYFNSEWAGSTAFMVKE